MDRLLLWGAAPAPYGASRLRPKPGNRYEKWRAASMRRCCRTFPVSNKQLEIIESEMMDGPEELGIPKVTWITLMALAEQHQAASV
jgi:hypothetical protein